MVNKKQIVYDTDGAECLVTDITSNSIEVSIKKKTKKGIDCKQWFPENNFNKRFNLNKTKNGK